MTTTTRLVRFVPMLAGALVFTAVSAPKASADPVPTPAIQVVQLPATAARHDIALNAVAFDVPRGG